MHFLIAYLICKQTLPDNHVALKTKPHGRQPHIRGLVHEIDAKIYILPRVSMHVLYKHFCGHLVISGKFSSAKSFHSSEK